LFVCATKIRKIFELTIQKSKYFALFLIFFAASMNSKIVFPDVIRRNLSVVEVILVVLQTAWLCRLPCGHLTVFEGRKNNDAATSAFGDVM